MILPDCPRLTRSGPSVVTLTLPCHWDEESLPIGGGEESAAGIPSNYIIRHDAVLHVLLRFFESEWSDVITFLRAVDEAAEAWTFHPDTLVAGTSFTVYLKSPSVQNGESVRPTRDEGDPTVLLLPIVLRRSTSPVFDLPLYPEV